MKALSVDCSSSKMYVCAKNEDNYSTLILEIGAKQSQELLPAIDFVLKKCGIKPSELDYTALCKGPGTFTGLRLAFSALKAVQLAFGVPVYAVSTLECYALPYTEFPGTVVSTVDAKKNQFFAAVYKNGEPLMDAKDTTADEVAKNIPEDETAVLCAGPDAREFQALLKEKLGVKQKVIAFFDGQNNAKTLFSAAEKMIAEKKEPLKDFEGPDYLRKSEAELALEK